MDMTAQFRCRGHKRPVSLRHLSLGEKPIESALKLLCLRKDDKATNFRIETLCNVK